MILYDCHNLGGAQLFAFTRSGQISTPEEKCVGINGAAVDLVNCSENDKSQLWDWNSKVIKIISEIKANSKMNLCIYFCRRDGLYTERQIYVCSIMESTWS